MPVHNVHPVGLAVPAQDVLEIQGLLLSLKVSVPDALASSLNAASVPIPAPEIGSALVDTGASCCCVEEERLLSLGLRPISQMDVLSPNGLRRQNVFFAKLAFPGTPIPALELQVVGVQLNQGQTISLIGRDVLKHCVLIYNGSMGAYTLSF